LQGNLIFGWGSFPKETYASRKPTLKQIQKLLQYIRDSQTFAINMGWLRLAGSFKLQVSFAKETYKRDDILQKKPTILRSLLIVATP